MDNIRKLILMSIIIISIIILSIVFLKFKEKKEETEGNVISTEEIFNIENKIRKDISKEDYYYIKICLNRYSIYSSNSKIISQASPEDLQEDPDYAERMQQQLLDIIPDVVKKEMNLNEENAYSEVGLEEGEIRINNIYKSLQTVNEIAYEESSSIYAYVVNLTINNQNKKQEHKLIVMLDKINGTFFIIPENYIKIKDFNLEVGNSLSLYKQKEIKQNDNNMFPMKDVTNQDICIEYFNQYKMDLKNDNERLYNYLDSKYREEKFGDYSVFEGYIQNNLIELQEAQIKQYKVEHKEEYVEYICKDQYQNLYIFREKEINNFELLLDTYTIPTEKFKEEYNKSDDRNKIMLNIDKWIQMLNNRDYKAAYEVLDETFKNNNFGSEENFQQYMREKFPLHYKLEFGEYSNETDIGMQKIVLTDITGEDATIIENTIIMKLKDNYDFVMSFEIK